MSRITAATPGTMTEYSRGRKYLCRKCSLSTKGWKRTRVSMFTPAAEKQTEQVGGGEPEHHQRQQLFIHANMMVYNNAGSSQLCLGSSVSTVGFMKAVLPFGCSSPNGTLAAALRTSRTSRTYQDDDPDRVVHEQHEAEDDQTHAGSLIHSGGLRTRSRRSEREEGRPGIKPSPG